MNSKYLNFYNNLIKLTTNKSLYKDVLNNKDTFSDRLSLYFYFILLLFLKYLKMIKTTKNYKKYMILYFRQLELSITRNRLWRSIY